MKRLTLFIFGLLVCWFVIPVTPALALYDPRTVPGNKVGVHILSPDEVENAATIVNSDGGDWGYVTVPIQPTDRDKVKWETFMQKCASLHLIPIIRITTIPQGGTWESGRDTDLVDFANFLNELSWPVENRYIVLFNEVNRSAEWGGAVNPEKYASIAKNARTIFKERSQDFFLLGPSLDDSLPDSSTSMSAGKYLTRMSVLDPAIWSYFDGWSAHSYPNPGFTADPKKTGATSITSYAYFQKYLKLAPKPTFITETGWDQSKVSRPTLISYWGKAWDTWNHDNNVVAVTPFVLNGGTAFAQFSLTAENGSLTNSGESLKNTPKQAGTPRPGTKSPITSNNTSHQSSGGILPLFKGSRALIKLENIFRAILGLTTKSALLVGDQQIWVELAKTPKEWEKGLSNRDSLVDVDGMLFIFPYSHVPLFWMKDTRFPLDMIWINRGVIIDITKDVPVSTSDKLPTYSPKSPADNVLEVPSGWSEANNIQIGDTVSLID